MSVTFSPAPKNVGRLDQDERTKAQVEKILARKRSRKPLRAKKWMQRGKPLNRGAKPLRAVGEGKRRRMAAYAAHLRSAHWKALRKVVFERDGYRCVDCGDEAGYFLNGKRDIRGLECDHLHYRTLFAETPKDCATRCRPCHRRKHAGQWWKRIPWHQLKGASDAR